jgi:hypothetical protein
MEKVWTLLGPEFGDYVGKRALSVWALYGLESVGAAFRNHISECMKHLGWKPYHVDHYMWMKAEICLDGGMLYWAYMFIYVYDILCMYHDYGMPLDKLDEYFKRKEGSIQVPTFYFGAKLKKTALSNDVFAWDMIFSNYVQSSVQNVKEYLTALPGNKKQLKKAPAPFTGGYKPERDESSEFDPIMVNFFQSQIGILRWGVELGCSGIITDVSMLSTYLCVSCEGHVDDVLHAYACLAHHHNVRVVFDPNYPVVGIWAFVKTDWKSMYGEMKELVPSDAPTPCGKEVDLSCSQGVQGLILQST